jgi:hypothetical protein
VGGNNNKPLTPNANKLLILSTFYKSVNPCKPLPCPAGRAIVDEVLPPRFLAESVPHLEPDSMGIAVVQQTGGWRRWAYAGRV